MIGGGERMWAPRMWAPRMWAKVGAEQPAEGIFYAGPYTGQLGLPDSHLGGMTLGGAIVTAPDGATYLVLSDGGSVQMYRVLGDHSRAVAYRSTRS